MAQYEKLNFVNGYPPALNAATLNHMDDGIATANEGVTALEETIANNKKETDTAFATKADKTDVYSINEADEMFLTRAEARSDYTHISYSEALNNTKANKTEVYTKTESDSLLSAKADKTEIDNLNITKANIDDVYTKSETDSKLSGKLNNSEGSVQRDNIEIGAVGSDEIADNSILPYHLSDGAVITEKIADGQITVDKLSDDVKHSINNDYKMNYLYVDLNYIETDDGFGITKFNSIMEANNSIKDNSKTNRYTILIYPGTYTELQNLYSGITDTANLQGIKTKDYVYYEGTQPYNPQSTCIEWDGAFGYDEGALTSETAVKKCIFHLTSGLNGMHTHIKNLHLKSKNTRYGLHIETGGYGRNVEWLFSNCIVEFGGRPDISGDRNAPCCGMGVSPYEKGEFSNCQFVFTDKEGITPDLVILNCHNNAETTVYSEVKPIKAGARIIFNRCDFNGYSVKFATTYEQNGTKNNAEFNKCSNYSEITTLPSATYGDNWEVIDSTKNSNYVLTDSDKSEIANLVVSLIPTTEGVEY